MKKNKIIDDSCLEQEQEHKNLKGYYEYNEDECYEFGGTSKDRKSRKKKSLWEELKEAFPFLVLMLLFCLGVCYYAFNYVN